MPLIKKPMRYAHPEGHTDVCYFTGEKGGMVTCGTDGDVRTWINLMDDDPSASCISEQATCVIAKKNRLYVGNDNNTVQILSHPELEKEGIVTRFSSTISALSTTKKSNLIVSGACDMRIQVSNIKTLATFELNGHEAPILGLSLDPQEEFIASSSGDGTIKIWSIKDKKLVHTLNNVVPKCNSFFITKVYATPSFHNPTGEYLAYPHTKDVVVLERTSWKEIFKLKGAEIKNELSICKYSECGKLIAASSVYGEIIVWEVESKQLVGYVEHQQNAKITSLVWNPNESNEIAFCDSLGQLGCIEVHASVDKSKDVLAQFVIDEHTSDDNFMFDVNNDSDNDNEISLSKIKASVINDDQKSLSDISEKKDEEKQILPKIHLQEPFQPGSSPLHLLSRYMVWNDVGIVMCFTSEDGEESNIEINFHDVTVHHSIHINNYLHHTMAAISKEAIVFATPSDNGISKIVVIVLQGWGSGNKEWTADLPDGEEAQAVAVGTNFVAVATNARTLRIFMVAGTQREVIALPGPVVAMNGYGNNLAVTYHSSIGAFGDQILSLLWIRVCGPNIRSSTLPVPLSPSSSLMWLGFSDLGSPALMDTDGIINIFDKKASLWRVACNTNRQSKGKFDNYFIIGINESDRNARCILCKGSHYPQTTPRPVVMEIPLTIPLCDPDSEKAEKEAIVWQIGSNPVNEKEAVLSLIAAACRNNAEFRAVELCQQIASQKVIELAIKYAGRINRVALANKLETIADTKEPDEIIRDIGTQEDIFNDRIENTEEEDPLITPVSQESTFEIKPLTPSQPFGRRSNPFLKKGNTITSKGLSGLDKIEEPQRPVVPIVAHLPVAKKSKAPQKESFVNWFQKNKKNLEEEFADVDANQLMKMAYARFKEAISSSVNNKIEEDEINKKRKLNFEEDIENSQSKRSTANKLAAFLNDN